MRRRGTLATLIVLALLAHVPAARAAEVHGASEAFATPGIVLAWGILRGTDEESTRVMLRMDVDAAYPEVAVVGIDPFTRAAQPIMESGRGSIVLAASRARFAQFPRTEVRLFRSRDRSPSAEPDLVVYYLGIPDTTPEFDDPARLDAYLDERLERLRGVAARRSP